MIARIFWNIRFLLLVSIDFAILCCGMIKDLFNLIYSKLFIFKPFSPKKILIIRIDRLGDAVVTTPLIKALKDVSPDVKIYVLASTKNRLLFENNPYVEKVFYIKADTWLKYSHRLYSSLYFLKSFLKEHLLDKNFWITLFKLKVLRIDLTLDLVGRKRTSFIGKITSKYCITHNLKEFSYFADYCLEYPYVSPYPKKHIVERYFDLCSRGVKTMLQVNPFDYPSELYLCNEKPIENRSIILFHIGGTAYRRLDNNALLEIIKSLSRKFDYDIYLIDEPHNPNLYYFKQNLRNFNIRFIQQMDLESLIKFVAQKVKLAFVSDGGTAHIFSAITNTFVYFGPSSVWVWYPWDKSRPIHIKTYESGVQVWQTQGKYLHRFIFYPISCSPCYEIGCKEVYCLKALKPEILIEELQKMIKIVFDKNKGRGNISNV